MKRTITKLALAGLALCVAAPGWALFAPITSITATGTSGSDTILLTSVTVGGETVPVSMLATGMSSGVFQGGTTPGFPAENADDFNITSFASRYEPLDTVLFGGGLYSDTNASAFDFVIFENGGNDSGTIQAIFADDSLGQPVAFGSSASFWGDTGFTSNVQDQAIKGMTFALTDLKDAVGNDLLPTSVIKGIRINSADIDPSTIAAVIPEPSVLALLAVGSVALGGRLRGRRS